ncbi:MAG: alcohol dehydrogenase catalytic domain-containing protein [Candidatus Bipolaricaulota bacterium]|nr:MAG: alcohol dehydrogenase catalytic domain-containing protein [Candidatus Bipolaricaulota bacterium]
MRAVVWDGRAWPEGLELIEIERPQTRPGWVLIRNRAAGICGSDLHYLTGRTRHLIPDENLPAVLGHENAGVVAEIGDGVEGLKVGDPVAAEPLHGCYETGRSTPCPRCQVGEYNLCSHRQIVGVPLVEMLPGGYGEYSIFHASRLFKMPRSVTFEAAALIDVLAVGVHAMTVGGPEPGMTVAVLGSGVTGIDTIQCLRAWGIRSIVATAKYPFQAEAAREAGATEVIQLGSGVDPVSEVLRMTDGRGVDQVYEAVGGASPVITQAVHMCRKGGNVIMLGIFDGELPVDLQRMIYRSVSILTSSTYNSTGGTRDFQIAVDLLANGQVDHDLLVTHRFSLDNWHDAVSSAFGKSDSRCLRSVIVHDD